MNRPNKRGFSTLHTKLPNNKLLMVLNSLIDFYYDGVESKYVTVNSYGACWVKNIKDKAISLKKEQIKDEVAYVLSNCYFTVGRKIFCQIFCLLVFLWRLVQLLFLSTYSYTSIKVSG